MLLMKKKKSGYHCKLTMQHAQYDVLYKTIFSTEHCYGSVYITISNTVILLL